ncbi:antitoxin MazE family protein [Methylobacterium organophilum]|uniref:antitoxin MazE family protein n=1 Tax=Methylobacterium organophilum TaxID=410 RepID=UPI001F148271|nr:antitoxin MazE family protein [Methylobacterium organophilum]UMY17291.1 antitoxin MazE family protein [Methylobacterium organophilum]
MPSSVGERVRTRREALRAAGLRPVQIWVPDTRAPGFAQECRRQSGVVAAADAADPELGGFMDAALRSRRRG